MYKNNTTSLVREAKKKYYSNLLKIALNQRIYGMY